MKLHGYNRRPIVTPILYALYADPNIHYAEMLKKVPKDHQNWDKETAVEVSRWALKAGKGQTIHHAAALAGDVSLNRGTTVIYSAVPMTADKQIYQRQEELLTKAFPTSKETCRAPFVMTFKRVGEEIRKEAAA